MIARAILLVALTAFAREAAAFSDEEFCRVLQARAGAENVRKPFWVDREIRDDGMTVLCVQRTIEFRRFFGIQPNGIGPDWERRLAADWNRRQCGGPMIEAIRNGWQIVEITRFPKSGAHPHGRELRAVAECR
jgi:hypothetical protein